MPSFQHLSKTNNSYAEGKIWFWVSNQFPSYVVLVYFLAAEVLTSVLNDVSVVLLGLNLFHKVNKLDFLKKFLNPLDVENSRNLVTLKDFNLNILKSSGIVSSHSHLSKSLLSIFE